MQKIKHLPLLPVVFALVVSVFALVGAEEEYPAGDGLLDPYAQNQALGKGVNFGNLMDAAPNEGSWSEGLTIQASHFDLAKAAGFDSVRIPIRFSAHAKARAPYTIDKFFLKRVDQVVGWGLERGFRIIVDLHHYEELHKDPDGHKERFVAMWRKLAEHFKDYPDELYYEILNEPSQMLDGPVWNELIAECLRAIREIDNHHTVIVDCANYSDPNKLNEIEIPDAETNCIITFHYYTPTLFCFQGIKPMGPNWATTGITWPGPPAKPVRPASGLDPWALKWLNDYNTVADPSQNPGGPGIIEAEIKAAAFFSLIYERPLWMSEFTAQDGADLASRVRWFAFVRQNLEKYKIPWSVWTLCSDFHSCLYDIKTGRWNQPLLEALGLKLN